MKAFKKVLPVIAALLLAAALLGCDVSFTNPGGGDAQGDSFSMDALTEMAGVYREQGERFERLLMPETSAFFYSYAGAMAGSARLAIEKLLWLRGEGESFEELSEGSRFADFDSLGKLCHASPFPFYFEGLICEFQGENDRAEELYKYAAVMSFFPDNGMDFYYLRNLEIGELYALRDTLCGIENDVYAEFVPVLYDYPRTVYSSIAEYLYLDAMELLEAGKYAEAVVPARLAVRIDPDEDDFWVAAVSAAMYADEPYQAVLFLEEGLKYCPDSEKLDAMLKAVRDLDNGLSEDAP